MYTLHSLAGEFDELRFVMPQVMIIKLKIEDPKILFEPTFRECRDIILRCFSEIIASGEGLSRVECELFPEMKGQRLLLRSVKIEEALVAEFTDKVMDIFKKNTVGPQKYVSWFLILCLIGVVCTVDTLRTVYTLCTVGAMCELLIP